MDTRFDKQQHPVRRKHLELEAQQMNRQMDDEATRLASLDQNRTSSCSHALHEMCVSIYRLTVIGVASRHTLIYTQANRLLVSVLNIYTYV